MALLGKLPASYPPRGSHSIPWFLPQPESEHQETTQFWWDLNAEHSLELYSHKWSLSLCSRQA